MGVAERFIEVVNLSNPQASAIHSHSAEMPPPFKNILVANRGEIAIRVFQAARLLGVPWVSAIYTTGEEDHPHVLQADHRICIGSSGVQSYLDIASVVRAAVSVGADAIHPGYGFLSENPDFAKACEAAGIVFIGPTSRVLALFGDKVSSRNLAISVNVPVSKGTKNPVSSSAEARAEVLRLGMRFPVVLKAIAGGGGRGMRVVHELAEIEPAFSRCQSEALSAFGNAAVFVEEWWTNVKHIEIQIAADVHGTVQHVFDRDCSIQNRNQKVVEIAPSPALAAPVRDKLIEAAIRIIRTAGLHCLATVEFLLDLKSGDFIFLEVNPRVQVEHTVTEEAFGVDLVGFQILLASGQPVGLSFTQKRFAVQARVQWFPLNGQCRVLTYREPKGVRVDSGVTAGITLSPSFDSMILKLIGVGPTFQAAVRSTIVGLEQLEITGVNTNRDKLLQILRNEKVSHKFESVFTSFYGDLFAAKSAEVSADGIVELKSPLNGTVHEVKVATGAAVKKGAVLMVLESMKTETEVFAPFGGVVKTVSVKKGDTVTEAQLLVSVTKNSHQEAEEVVVEGGNKVEVVLEGAAAADSVKGIVSTHPVWLRASHTNPLSYIADSENSRFATNLVLADQLKARLRLVGNLDSRVVEKRRTQKKLPARERIALTIDEGTEFFELSALAAFDMYDKKVFSAAVITGIGIVCGVECMFIAGEGAVKAGSVFPITTKKTLRAQEIAYKCNLPCIYLADSAGAFLPLQAEIFPETGGRVFRNQSIMSAAKIPQLCACMGMNTAGGAYVPALCDQVVMVEGQSAIFLAGPPLVKAATGEVVSTEDLGGAQMHTTVSGVADYRVKTEQEALLVVREMLANCNYVSPGRRDPLISLRLPSQWFSPAYPIDSILEVLPAENRTKYDCREVILRIVDGSPKFHEFKKEYSGAEGVATNIVCGFGRVFGITVGFIGNNGVITTPASLKATQFLQLCASRNIFCCFLQNCTGFMVGKSAERGGITKDGSKLVRAVSCLPTPKMTIIIGGSHGAANYSLAGRAYDPEFLFMYPNAKISVMGGQQAAEVLMSVSRDKSPEAKARVIANYEKESSAYYSTARIWDDGIIDPRDTRKAIGRCLSIMANKPRYDGRDVYGTFRM